MIGFPRALVGLYKCALVAISLVAIMVGPARPQDANQTLDTAQIESLVAPIALYPDNLVSQILMASTYPLEVVEAARWSQENPGVTEAALQDALQNQKWDPSVKALTAVPQVLRMMNDRLQWTQQLGDAFLAQQSAVLNAVQVLRARADKAGNLQTTSQQTVTRTENPAYVSADSGLPPIVYTIVPAEPEVIFVPIYDPVIVFGPWPYPWYPPFYWYPPGFVPSNVLAFAAGIFVGAAIWADVNWWDRRVLINVDRYNRFNRTRITSNTWRHDSTHRRGVPYSDRRIANLFDKRRPAAKAGMGGMGGMAAMRPRGMAGMRGMAPMRRMGMAAGMRRAAGMARIPRTREFGFRDGFHPRTWGAFHPSAWDAFRPRPRDAFRPITRDAFRPNIRGGFREDFRRR